MYDLVPEVTGGKKTVVYANKKKSDNNRNKKTIKDIDRLNFGASNQL